MPSTINAATKAKYDLRHRPHPNYTFWLYSPEGDGLTFWRTAKERDDYAETEIRTYLDDNQWFEEVEGVCAGTCTHVTRQCDVVEPVGDIDEDGYDEAGEFWPDQDAACKCDYKLTPIATVLNENTTPPSGKDLSND
jgi:hypothetical protein